MPRERRSALWASKRYCSRSESGVEPVIVGRDVGDEAGVAVSVGGGVAVGEGRGVEVPGRAVADGESVVAAATARAAAGACVGVAGSRVRVGSGARVETMTRSALAAPEALEPVAA
jgi:hypothetical protein